MAEAGVIGKPDAQRGTIVKAFVRLASGFIGDASLTEELRAHVRNKLASYKAPREIDYVDEFPMTSSGKIN